MPSEQTANKVIFYVVVVGIVVAVCGMIKLYEKMDSVEETFENFFGFDFDEIPDENEREDRIFNENVMFELGKMKKQVGEMEDMKNEEIDEIQKKQIDEIQEKQIDETHDKQIEETHEMEIEEMHEMENDEIQEKQVDEIQEKQIDETHEKQIDEIHQMEIVGEMHEMKNDEIQEKQIDEMQEKQIDETHEKEMDEIHEKEIDEIHEKEKDEIQEKQIDEIHEKEKDEIQEKQIDETHEKKIDEIDEKEKDKIQDTQIAVIDEKTKKIIYPTCNAVNGTGLMLLGENQTNFALESSGAEILYFEDGAKCTLINYISKLYGLIRYIYSVENILDPSLLTGYCFAFANEKIFVNIKLSSKAFIEYVSVGFYGYSEHFGSKKINSAPKDFKVYGTTSRFDRNLELIGSFSYDNEISKPFQSFPVKISPPKSYLYIKFEFLTNHGNEEYTCISSVSVFGTRDEE